MDDLRGRARIVAVEDLADDVLLGTRFIDRCTWGIFPAEREIVPRNSRPVAILSMQKKDIGITTEIEEADIHMTADSSTRTEEHSCVS